MSKASASASTPTKAGRAGRQFHTLNVLDEGNREGLAIEVGTSIPD